MPEVMRIGICGLHLQKTRIVVIVPKSCMSPDEPKYIKKVKLEKNIY
jgi:hypothetical protein